MIADPDPQALCWNLYGYLWFDDVQRLRKEELERLQLLLSAQAGGQVSRSGDQVPARLSPQFNI